MAPIKDTQEEKSQPDLTILPSCLNLDVLRVKSTEDPKTNVVLSCMKVPKDEGPGEEPSCPRYSCMSGPTRRNCSAISSIQTYHPVQCDKEGQKPRNIFECRCCRAKSDEDHGNIDLCCPPEVLENVTLKDTEEEPRKIRSSQERRSLAYPTRTWDRPTPINTRLCLRTGPEHQPPGLGQESSQGSVMAAGAAGAVGAVVGLGYLGYLVVKWWRGRRGRRKERHSSSEPLRVEEGQDGDGGTPGM